MRPNNIVWFGGMGTTSLRKGAVWTLRAVNSTTVQPVISPIKIRPPSSTGGANKTLVLKSRLVTGARTINTTAKHDHSAMTSRKYV